MKNAATVVVALLVVCCPALADKSWVAAFGDSITEGCCDNPGDPDGGYPERLAALMTCSYLDAPWGSPSGQQCPASDPLPGCAVVRAGDCVIANRGKSNEWAGGAGAPGAFTALTRLQNYVLPEWPWDTLIFMEGTNDIFNEASITSIMDAIEVIEEITTEAGVDFVVATIIEFHPDALTYPPQNRPLLNIWASSLNTKIRSMAAARNRYLSDQWTRLCQPTGNDLHGHNRIGCLFFDYGEKTTVGHPSGLGGQYDGYDNMADAFRDTLTQAAVPGAATPNAPAGEVCGSSISFDWTKEAGESANWYRLEINATEYDAWHQEVDWRPAEIDLCLPDADADDDCSFLNPLTLGAGSHSWRLRGRNPGGLGPWTAPTAFDVVPAAPAATTPISPLDSVCVSKPTYQWQEVAEATGYALEVFDGSTWIAAGSYDSSACTASVCTASPASPDLTVGDRRFRVTTENVCGGTASIEETFAVYLGAPAATVPRYPDDVVFDTTPTYLWDDLANAASYDLEVFDGSSWAGAGTYGGPDCDGALCTGSPATPVLTPGARKFRVATQNPCSSGPLSSELTFTVLDCAAYPDLDLENTTVTGVETRRACGQITAGNLGLGDYVIDDPAADVLFHAGSVIEIRNGFAVVEGLFTAATDL